MVVVVVVRVMVMVSKGRKTAVYAAGLGWAELSSSEELWEFSR